MPDVIEMLQALPHAVTPGPAGPDLAAADVARGHRALRQRRRRRLAGAAGAGAGAVAAAVLVATSVTAPQPATGPGSARAGSARAGSASHAAVVTSALVTLAAHIKASDGARPGNASLVIDRQVIGGKLMQVVYGLYTD